MSRTPERRRFNSSRSSTYRAGPMPSSLSQRISRSANDVGTRVSTTWKGTPSFPWIRRRPHSAACSGVSAKNFPLIERSLDGSRSPRCRRVQPLIPALYSVVCVARDYGSVERSSTAVRISSSAVFSTQVSGEQGSVPIPNSATGRSLAMPYGSPSMGVLRRTT